MVVVPATASAQAAIAGSVKNVHGDPMAGVTGGGQQSVADRAVAHGRHRHCRPLPHRGPAARPLRGAVHAQGWTRSSATGIELTGSFTATVDAELTVGTGHRYGDGHGGHPGRRRPQREARADALGRCRAVRFPRRAATTRSCRSSRASSPTSTTRSPGRRRPRRRFRFTAAGRTRAGSSLDGLTIGSPPSGNSATSYVVDVGNAQEVTFTTAGGLGETETAGLVMNIVPKSGGNTTHGSLFASGTGETSAVRQPDAGAARRRGRPRRRR